MAGELDTTIFELDVGALDAIIAELDDAALDNNIAELEMGELDIIVAELDTTSAELDGALDTTMAELEVGVAGNLTYAVGEYVALFLVMYRWTSRSCLCLT